MHILNFKVRNVKVKPEAVWDSFTLLSDMLKEYDYHFKCYYFDNQKCDLFANLKEGGYQYGLECGFASFLAGPIILVAGEPHSGNQQVLFTEGQCENPEDSL